MSTYGEGSFNTAIPDSPSRATTRPRVVFFGSGPVAAESLELLAEWADVEAVVTKPQPPHHKQPFPVLVVAEKLGLQTHTPNSKAELSALIDTKPYTSTLGVVIDYGFIINQDVIDYFPLGIVNSHFSLLPQWRGADPITFSILSGQDETGVSLMLIVEKMDEGPLLAQAPLAISPSSTTPELTSELIELSNFMLRETIPLYLSGAAVPAPQDTVSMAKDPTPSYSRKLTKVDSVLDWNKPAEQLEREIRAFIEWPKSRTELAGKEVVITKAHVLEPSPETKDLALAPGSAFIHEKQLFVATAEGILVVDSLKPAGKPEMPIAAFLAGYGKSL
jgi:methionyl-tRNA formyltransferase